MQLWVVDAGSGAAIRSVELGSYVPGAPAVAGRHAFVGHFGEAFVCVDTESGDTVWKSAGKVGPVFSCPALTRDCVVFGARDMTVHGLNRADGKESWVFKAQGDVDSSPVVAGDRVVFGADDGRLYVVNVKDGTEAWSYDIGRPIRSSPAVAGGMVVVGADDGGVYAFGPAGGNADVPVQEKALK
jgi:outer membrane protein assembly factor BamB